MRNERKRDEVLIVDDFHPALLAGLSRLNFNFHYNPEITKERILDIIENYTGLIVRSKIECDVTFFEKAKQLKWIAKGGSGIDSIDEEQTIKRKILIINAPEGNRNAVAEHTIGLLLNLTNNIAHACNSIKKLHWDREANRGIEISEKVMGIIGFGNIGEILAKRLSGFDMKVLAYDKYKQIKSPFAIESTLEQIFAEADYLSLHVPLTKETKGMVNQAFISQFKKPIGLINASRGKVVVSKDVLQALELGQISFFGADVIENERLKKWSIIESNTYTRLLSMQNVIITPHIAGWTRESYRKISETLIEKIEQEISLDAIKK